MAQVVVRKLDEAVKQRLKRRAAQHGHSMEAEIRDILCDAVGVKAAKEEGLGALITRHFAGKGLNFEVQELRGEEARPAKFRK